MRPKFTSHDEHNPIGQRLKLEMKKRGVSSVELAAKADVKTSFLYDVISGKSANPSSLKLARVAESLGISLAYLAGTSDSPLDGYQFALPSDQADFITLGRLEVEQYAASARWVAVDSANEPFQFKRDWLKRQLKAAPEELKYHTVQSDGMAPTLLAGDVVLVNMSQKHPSPPGLFVLFDGLALIVKRLECLSHQPGSTMKIISDNPHYSSYETLIEESNIVGRVVWFARTA